MILHPELIPEALKAKEWKILAELARTLQEGIPKDLAQSDPTRFRAWMKGLTYCYLIGWHHLNEEVLEELESQSHHSEP